MKPIALTLLVFAAFAVAPASAAQNTPSARDSLHLGPEADRVETAVMRCGQKCRDTASLADRVQPLAVQMGPSPLTVGIEGDRRSCRLTLSGIPIPTPLPAEITRQGITVRPLGHPEPEPATE